MKVFATVSGGGIYVSTNGAVSWSKTSAPDLEWVRICASADAGTLLALHFQEGGGAAYRSLDFGATWKEIQGGLPYTDVACSADGSRIFLASTTILHGGGGLQSSTDSGETWAPVFIP